MLIKIQQAAELAKLDVHDFCTTNSNTFKSLFDKSNIGYSAFIRTTDRKHKSTVQDFWRALKDAGWIYKGMHEGWYCVSDETFVPDSMVAKSGEGNV
jgi:methionyl-tRNA synthetase